MLLTKKIFPQILLMLVYLLGHIFGASVLVDASSNGENKGEVEVMNALKYKTKIPNL